jgi:hypothetical protein
MDRLLVCTWMNDAFVALLCTTDESRNMILPSCFLHSRVSLSKAVTREYDVPS